MGRRRTGLRSSYDPSDYPPFAVTVDVVILAFDEGVLRLLVIRRGAAPFKGRWALPGGFKLPTESLDEAARRELFEETGVEAPGFLRQLGAYGDPGRDPRMNVVTIAYLAVLSGPIVAAAGSDAAHAEFRPVADVVAKPLAFDHRRILDDALECVRDDLDRTGLAASFLGPTFTVAELRAVYEAIWDVSLDQANFRRSLLAEDGWLEPTGQTASPGPAGGKPAELFARGKRWATASPLRRRSPREEGKLL